jgi:hypothetical protein
MNEHSVSESRFGPNDEQPDLLAKIFYASNAGFLSYFGIFLEILRNLATNPEAIPSSRHSAKTRGFASLAPCMAIV